MIAQLKYIQYTYCSKLLFEMTHWMCGTQHSVVHEQYRYIGMWTHKNKKISRSASNIRCSTENYRCYLRHMVWWDLTNQLYIKGDIYNFRLFILEPILYFRSVDVMTKIEWESTREKKRVSFRVIVVDVHMMSKIWCGCICSITHHSFHMYWSNVAMLPRHSCCIFTHICHIYRIITIESHL